MVLVEHESYRTLPDEADILRSRNFIGEPSDVLKRELVRLRRVLDMWDSYSIPSNTASFISEGNVGSV